MYTYIRSTIDAIWILYLRGLEWEVGDCSGIASRSCTAEDSDDGRGGWRSRFRSRVAGGSGLGSRYHLHSWANEWRQAVRRTRTILKKNSWGGV